MMKKPINYIVAMLLFVGASSLLAQQQSLYTNYLLNSYAYNAGVVGSQSYMQANMFYRNQWTGFEGAPKTYLISMYGPMKKMKNAGLGGMIMADKTGLISTNTGYLTFAYHVKINKKTKLGLGISAGLKQYKVRLYDVRAYDQGDELLTGNLLTANSIDANAGLYLHGPNLFVGLSSMNMLNNKIRWKNPQGRLSPHYYGVIGYNYVIKKDYAIQPSVLVKFTDPVPVQMEYSLKFTYKDWIWLGGTYREKDAFGTMVGVTLIKKINVAYSYDFSLSTIKKYQQGSHEICLSYYFIKKKSINASDEEEFKVIDNSVKQNLKNKKADGTERKKDETQAAPPKKEIKAPLIKQENNENKTETPATEETKAPESNGNNTEVPKTEEPKSELKQETNSANEVPKTEENKPQLNKF